MGKLKASAFIFDITYFLAFLIFGIIVGLRDFSVGTDTRDYVRLFEYGLSNPIIRSLYENGFITFADFIHSYTVNPQHFILTLTLLTVTLFAVAGRIIFPAHHRLLYLIMLVGSPIFFQFLVNAIRQGIALGILLIAMAIFTTVARNRTLSFITVGVSYFIHLPTAINSIVLLYKKEKILLTAWIVCLTLSILSGFYTPFLEPLLGGTKYTGYFKSTVTQVGFRIDFFLFSLLILPVVLLKSYDSYTSKTKYFINSYLIINAVSFLMNGLAFANRFIIVSWALLPIIYCLAITETSQTHNGFLIRYHLLAIYIISSLVILIVA